MCSQCSHTKAGWKSCCHCLLLVSSHWPLSSPRILCLLIVFVVLMHECIQIGIPTHIFFGQSHLEGIHGIALICTHTKSDGSSCVKNIKALERSSNPAWRSHFHTSVQSTVEVCCARYRWYQLFHCQTTSRYVAVKVEPGSYFLPLMDWRHSYVWAVCILFTQG